VASIDKRKGAWRVQVRRGRRSWNKTFRMKADGEAWAREIESAADRGVDPLASSDPRLTFPVEIFGWRHPSRPSKIPERKEST